MSEPNPYKSFLQLNQPSRRQELIVKCCCVAAGWGILFGIVTLAISLSPYKVTCSEAETSWERAGFGDVASADLFYAKKTAEGKTCTKL
ncbi:hypothetical protein [Oscillatoria sp. FACHB-1406]|uniref:hypothetical protein n=1 Tax=Oscillatoria sp. FACHB-1406 TaxID=2692846 RepID=UPI0016872A4C|nr:hypothetical protein [Oscillatoria sp. FACHB-1406]MBD2579427.1 hypothetical protein [Oscillatoria sp. FACHB-1406]